MRIFLNGKEADTGLDTRPITRADYDALSSSDKNLDVLYLVDNSVTRMTKSRETEFEWVAPRTINDASHQYISCIDGLALFSENNVETSSFFRNGANLVSPKPFIISFGYRTAFRALRVVTGYYYREPASVSVCFSENSVDWSDEIVLENVSPPAEDSDRTMDYYLPNGEIVISRFMKVSVSEAGIAAERCNVNLISFLISPQQDSEGSSGESYSRYVLYYHRLPITSGSITDYVSKTEFDETIGEISTLLDIILGEGDAE